MKHQILQKSRRDFIKKSGIFLGGASILPASILAASNGLVKMYTVPINAHLWVYASAFPPDWDCTPVLETVFSDLQFAHIDGLELMKANFN